MTWDVIIITLGLLIAWFAIPNSWFMSAETENNGITKVWAGDDEYKLFTSEATGLLPYLNMSYLEWRTAIKKHPANFPILKDEALFQSDSGRVGRIHFRTKKDVEQYLRYLADENNSKKFHSAVDKLQKDLDTACAQPDAANLSDADQKQQETKSTKSRFANKSFLQMQKAGCEALEEFEQMRPFIANENVRKSVKRLEITTRKMLQDAEADPNDVAAIQKFFNKYMPTTRKLVRTYAELSQFEATSGNIGKSTKNIETMLRDIADAFDKKFVSLYDNNLMDIESDMDVMRTLMNRDGFGREETPQVKEG